MPPQMLYGQTAILEAKVSRGLLIDCFKVLVSFSREIHENKILGVELKGSKTQYYDIGSCLHEVVPLFRVAATSI
jgi:hypothetical protein